MGFEARSRQRNPHQTGRGHIEIEPAGHGCLATTNPDSVDDQELSIAVCNIESVWLSVEKVSLGRSIALKGFPNAI